MDTVISNFTDVEFLLISMLLIVYMLVLTIFSRSIDRPTHKEKANKRFREQIRKSIIHDNLEINDIQHLHESWEQDRQSVLQSLRVMLATSLSEEDEELKDKIDKIRELIDYHQEREPYSELPENISIQLHSISSKGEELEKQVNQLASSLTELYLTNRIELAKQKKYALMGIIIGAIGIAMSLLSFFGLK